MKKIMTIFIIGSIAVVGSMILLFLWTTETIRTTTFIHKDTEKFINKMNFQSLQNEDYKILGAVIHPFFRDLKSNTYSGHLGAFGQQEGYEYMHVFNYKLIYFENGQEKKISKNINLKTKFKKAYRADLKLEYPYAGLTLFHKKELITDNTKPISLEVDLLISQDKKKSRRTITYNLEYRVDKYQSLNIEGW